MVRFKEVDPAELEAGGEGHRGRVSYPILKSFLETGYVLAELDRTGMQQSMQSLYSSLGAYIRNHDLPIKLFSRKGQLMLMRLDLHPDGTPNPNWQEDMEKAREERRAIADPINADEVAKRFQEEKDKVTK